MGDYLRLLCSTDFLWGAEPPEVVRLLMRLGCEGLVLSTEPPHYLPSMMHRSSLSALKAALRDLDTIVAVRSPDTDVNIFSHNPHISEASIRSIGEAARLAYTLDADFLVIRPSYKPFKGNPAVAVRKLQIVISRIARDQYAAFELIGSNSVEIADQLMDKRLGAIYVHGMSPSGLLKHRKLVGISMYIAEGSPPKKVIPGLREDTPYLLLFPVERHLYSVEELRRLILRTKNWRNSLI